MKVQVKSLERRLTISKCWPIIMVLWTCCIPSTVLGAHYIDYFYSPCKSLPSRYIFHFIDKGIDSERMSNHSRLKISSRTHATLVESQNRISLPWNCLINKNCENIFVSPLKQSLKAISILSAAFLRAQFMLRNISFCPSNQTKNKIFFEATAHTHPPHPPSPSLCGEWRKMERSSKKGEIWGTRHCRFG